MYLSKEYKEDYERRFNAYIMKIIVGTFKDYLRSKKKEILKVSLNERLDSGMELLELIIGDEDINIEEKIIVSKLEELLTDPIIREAVKPLTYKEKLAVFLRIIELKNSDKIAKLMGYSDRSGVNKKIKSAINKIRKNLRKKGVFFNDKF